MRSIYMQISTEEALKQLDDVIGQFNKKVGSPAATTGHIVTRMRSVIRRLSPPGSPYVAEARTDNEYELRGVVLALRLRLGLHENV